MPPDSAVAETTSNAAPAAPVTGTSNEPRSAQELAAFVGGEFQKALAAQKTESAEALGKQLNDALATLRAEYDAKLARYAVPGLEQRDIDKFQIRNLINVLVTKNTKGAEYEIDLCREAALTVGKDMSAGVDSLGGFIVPVQVMTSKMIPLLQARMIAQDLGVQDLSGLSGSPVQIPKITGGTTAQWIGENAGPTASDVTFGQLELTPHLVAARTQISLRLANLSSPAAEGIITKQIAKDLALAIDAAVFNGTGGSNQPTGVLQTAGIQTSSFGSAVASTAYNALIDMMTKLETANAASPTSAWAIDPVTWSKLQKQLDATDQPKQRRLFDSLPIGDKLLGFKHRESTALPSNTIIFADWEQVVLGRWGTMILRASDQAGTAWQNFQVWIQGGVEVDVGVMQPASIVNATSVS